MKNCIDLNCDMGEGFGQWQIDKDIDVNLMPFISSINLAAGFHAGDPSLIQKTIHLAKQHNIGVGVHPGYRDLVGFGRRHILASADELVNDVLYQVGAVTIFLNEEGIALQHFKLHGALYMHAASDHEFAEKLITRIHAIYPELPVFVMADTAIAKVAQSIGQPVINEFFADRHYGDNGQIIFTRDVGVLTPEIIANKVIDACQTGQVTTATGNRKAIYFDTVCIHSDTQGAFEITKMVRQALDDKQIEVSNRMIINGCN